VLTILRNKNISEPGFLVLTLVRIRTTLILTRTNLELIMNFLPTLRELVRTYQGFVDYSAPHFKQMGLTHSQFDVIATLGNQPPMTCKELGEKTLITKGTLTGILERLEAKGLIKKYSNTEDARSYKTGLTKEGQKVFDKSFTEHLKYLEKAFGKLSKKELETTTAALKSLRKAFETI